MLIVFLCELMSFAAGLACLGLSWQNGKTVLVDRLPVCQTIFIGWYWLTGRAVSLSLSLWCVILSCHCPSMSELCFLYKGSCNCVISRCFTHKRKHARCTCCTLVISSCGKKFFQISIISIRCVSAKMAAHLVVPCLESGPCWKHLLPLASTCVHLPLLCQSPQYATVLALDKAGSDSLQPGYLAQVLEICWISSQNSRVQSWVGLRHSDMPTTATCQEDQLRCRRPRHRMSKPTGGCLGHILRASQSGASNQIEK